MSDLDLATIDRLTGFKLGIFDAPCPACGPGRRDPANRKRQVLRIWRQEPDFATFACARCGLQGWAADKERPNAVPTIRKPAIVAPGTADDRTNRQAGKALFLWHRRQPAIGSPVEKYLRDVRRYFGTIPATIAYLPATKPEHHPAMISAFGCPTEPEPGVINLAADMVHGIHLTLLKPDGSGKAGTGRDKIMVGPSNGWPIVVAPPNDLLGLVVCEGVESGLSIAEATGLAVWVAGAAGRMPALADKVPDWIDYLTIAAEADKAGRAGALGLAQRLEARGLSAGLQFLSDEKDAA